MKVFKYILNAILMVAVLWSCSEDSLNDLDFLDSAVAPTNVAALFTITQDNTGTVTIIPTAEGAVLFEINYGDASSAETIKSGKKATHVYAEGTYTVNITAKGITDLKTEYSKEIVVSFNTPEFGSDPIIENDAAKSKQVNVTVPNDAKWAMFFDAYFVENGVETILTGNVGDKVSYTYANAGAYTVKVVLKGGAIATVDYVKTDFVVTEILQPITSAPEQPSRVTADYISIFSDKYTNVAGSDFNPGWGQSTVYNAFDLNGDAMLQYATLNYQGIQIGTAQDVSAMETLHIDVWSATAKSINFYPLPVGIAAANEKFYTLNLLADQWNSFDIPLSYFTDLGLALNNIHQFKFTGSGTIFVDNIYFYKAPSVVAKLPITFDNAEVNTFEAFLDATFEMAVSPTDANNPVGKIINIGQGWGWEGVSLDLGEWIDVSSKKVINVDFYNDGAAHTVLLKLEDSTSPKNNDGNPTVFEEVIVPVSNTGWSTLAFNFTSGKKYDTVVLFVDGGVYDIKGTYYFDNVIQP